MVRYVQRPWYSPLGLMATNTPSYVWFMCASAVIAVFPFRYQISEYFERQHAGPHVELRHKAVKYYSEMERMHRRQALVNLDNMQDDNAPHRLSASMAVDSLKTGDLDQEYNYWYAHARDAARAEKLMIEIRELKAKIAAESA
ncbi:hypothetical protein ABB37_06413 [Leptomonas pyrrhocoris]|uniref:Uncharacterized protein n=1 Tax=Leptomonas pyrrhocoris TaxID=157538 RepID=A0A0N0DU11_LEPPY|nr:hypothetical protein ABB37_06413 [Leptomonas pyrrhocoris]KPA78262.1 hypothetical protein ABB37_06413 [Leptomonas pyrrhocoris]|eukprot:XP_015656701.1 hypothetical protein ABB37_06413 [Leptomonas pyrrhocoris]